MIDYLSLYTFIDALEIAVCIFGYYLINSWLYNQDNKQLLQLWYGYHAVVIGAYLADLQTVFFLSASCFPLVLMLACIFNQEKLQKMFVVAQRLDQLTTTTHLSNWADELIKFALIRLNEQKDLYTVIEFQDNLAPLVNAHEVVHADLKKQTLELLYDSFMMPKDSFLWVTSTGKILSLAAHWKTVRPTAPEQQLDKTVHITHATDCVVLKSDAATRKFTIITGAKIIENLSAHHALNILYELQTTAYKKEEGSHVIKDSFRSYNDTHFS